MKIWKFKLEATGIQSLSMPKDAKILTVQMQGSNCCLWAMCDEDANLADRQVAIYATGEPLPGYLGEYIGEYIATFQIEGGSLVFHAFDLGEVQ